MTKARGATDSLRLLCVTPITLFASPWSIAAVGADYSLEWSVGADYSLDWSVGADYSLEWSVGEPGTDYSLEWSVGGPTGDQSKGGNR